MSWRDVTLVELVEEFSLRPKDMNLESSTLKFYGVSNTEGIIPTKNAAKDKAEKYKIIEKNCFAYNPYRINVGSIALLEDDIKGLISPAYVVFKPKLRSIIPQLLLMFLKSPEGLRQIKIHARGTVRQALRFTDLCKIELSLPDYDEQIEFFKKIKDTENTSGKLKLEFTHQLYLVKQLRQAFLREAMQGNLLPQDSNDEPASVLLEKIKAEKERLIKEKKIKKQKILPPIIEEEIPFEIPENWAWCRLGQIMTFGPYNGFSPKESKKGFGIKCLTLTATTRGYFDPSYFKYVDEKIAEDSYLWLKDGDILLQRGNSLDYVGIAALCKSINDNFIYPDLMIKIRVSKIILDEFIHLLLISPLWRTYFQQNASGAQKTMPKINQGVVTKTLVPLPPAIEQKRIVAKLNALMLYCDNLEISIKESQQKNELLLKQVLTEALGLKIKEVEQSPKKASKAEQKTSKFDPNTTLMEIVALIKMHGKLHAEELWKMSKFYGKAEENRDIDGFYAELKKLIEKEKTIKEAEKGYLELV